MKKVNKLINMNFFGGYLISAILICVMTIIFNLFDSQYNNTISNAIIITSLLSLGIGLLSLYRYKKISVNNIIWLIFLCSLFVKIGYAIKYPYTVNQHDLETIDANGHLNYIYRLAEFKGLPDTNEWQLYNPPLHYIISSVFFNISRLFGWSIDESFENLQMLTVFWSSSVSIIGLKISRRFNFKGLPLILTFALIAFHPFFTVLGGSINNDALALFLVTVSLYYLIKYQQSLKSVDLALFSISAGMSIMTKYSAFFAIFAMLIYLAAYSIRINKISIKGIALTLVPIMILGFWFWARNAVLFGQNIVHYNKLNQYSLLYIPYPFISRIFTVTGHEFSLPYCNPFNDMNIILYSLKNSLFGEFTFNSVTQGFILLFLNVIFVLATVISIIVFIKKRSAFAPKKCYIPILFVFVTQIVFYLLYSFIEPYGCSMNLRIVPMTILCGIIMFGYLIKFVHIRTRTSKLFVVLYASFLIGIVLFVILSSTVFI